MAATREEKGEGDEEEERVQTRRTTRSMQAETGATMRMISSPRESRRVGVELGSCAIGSVDARAPRLGLLPLRGIPRAFSFFLFYFILTLEINILIAGAWMKTVWSV